jgi:hypothetical protein
MINSRRYIPPLPQRGNILCQYSFLCLSLLFLGGCDEGKYIEGNGKIVSEVRKSPPFNNININGNYTVILSKGSKEAIEVQADENLMDFIQSKVENETLIIFDKNRIKSKKTLRIFISFNNINLIKTGGAPNIIIQAPLITDHLILMMNGAGTMDLKVIAKTLNLELSGTGIINLEGEVEKNTIDISGAGNLDAYKLISKDCDVNLSGIGGAQIHVLNQLNASLSGVGGINYKGNPAKVKRSVAGIGRIICEKN